jgi:hypothetical protein
MSDSEVPRQHDVDGDGHQVGVSLRKRVADADDVERLPGLDARLEQAPERAKVRGLDVLDARAGLLEQRTGRLDGHLRLAHEGAHCFKVETHAPPAMPMKDSMCFASRRMSSRESYFVCRSFSPMW